LKGFQELTSVDDALRTFMNAFRIGQLKTVSVPLNLALGRVLAEDIVAEEDLPRFDRSAVDGFAVKAHYTTGASQFKPKILRAAEGGAVKVWTGNPILEDVDAVVMLENARCVKDGVEVWSPVTPGENVSERGEDVSKGDVAVKKGTRLGPQHLGLIAALGTANVEVFQKPKIAVLATGNELAEPDAKLKSNQVFEVNRYVLSAYCVELGAEPIDLGIAKDNLGEITERLRSGLEMTDAVLTTGGTSVGFADLVPDAVNSTGRPGVIVHGVAMRPAMPTALAVVNGKPVVMLSGNPVAAIVGFEVFARPLICRLLGLNHAEPRPAVKARMTRKVATALGRMNFVRVHVFRRGGEFLAESVSVRGSGVISTMTRANGYVMVPENREGLAKGEMVDVKLFDVVEE